MAYVTVDIELSEIETDDLFEELYDRVRIKKLTHEEKKEFLQSLSDELEINLPESFAIITIADQLKFEHLIKVFNKYSWEEVIDRLPE